MSPADGTPEQPSDGARPVVAASGARGGVAATHELAARAASDVLRDGGNAIDAAVTGAFVLQVVEPHLNGPGGDATILFALQGKEPRVMCGQGPAPAGATAAHYRSLGLDLVPGTGPLAAAVPGAVPSWLRLLRDHGTIRLRRALEPAIQIAREGHVPLTRFVELVDRMMPFFEEHWPTSAAFWGQHRPVAGQPWCNPVLADTWERLIGEAEALCRADQGRELEIDIARGIWRTGFVGQALERQACVPTMDSSGSAHAGVLTVDDLASWTPEEESTWTGSWGPYTVHKAGPWTQGPVFLQQLALLADLAPRDADADDPVVRHRLVEQTKLAMADRDAWYGDAPTPARLLDVTYSAQRRALVAPSASLQWRPGRPDAVAPKLPRHVRDLVAGDDVLPSAGGPGAGEPTFRGDPPVAADGTTRGDTCHIAVVDQWGQIVAATPSGGWLQSNPTVPDLGFPLGTRLQMCWLDEGLPATLTPGRRPRSTLSPTIVEVDGVPMIGFGTPGGDQQDQWTFHTFVRLAHAHAAGGRLDADALADAIAAPGWHTDHLIGSFWPRGFEPGSLSVEPDTDADLVADLRSRGHRVQVTEAKSLGRVCMVCAEPEGTGDAARFHAAASTRMGQGGAEGVQ